VADTQVLDRPPRTELTEHLTTLGAGRDLVVIAPHGGMIEEHTDTQAELVLAGLSRAGIRGLGGARCWVCRGFSPGGGAHRRWHITSTDISEHSFPRLKTIMAPPPFTYAVSFHGFSLGDEVPLGIEILIGGRASGTNAKGKCRSEELRLLQARIRDALRDGPTDLRVLIAPPGDPLGGGSARNILNRLSSCGVQIEQTPAARQDDPEADDFIGLGYERIAQVVADTFVAALRDGLVDPETGERITDPVGGGGAG
jgi:phage replication-related protein YjqB (UPF0714/DUF867 family)